MLVESAFHGVKGGWFLHVEASKRVSVPDGTLLPQLENGDFVCLPIAPDNRFGSGYVGGEAAKVVNPGLKLLTKEPRNSYSPDGNKWLESEVLKKQDISTAQDGIAETCIRCKKEKLKKRVREEIPVDDSHSTDQNEADKKVKDGFGYGIPLDASHIIEVSPSAKRKKKSKKNKLADAENLALSFPVNEPSDVGNVVPLSSERGKGFDGDFPCDEGSKEVILSQNEKTEISRIKDDGNAGGNNGTNLTYKIEEKEEGLEQDGGQTTFVGDTNSKCKSLGHDEGKVKLKDGLGSPNSLDASGLIEDRNPHDHKRKKSKKKKNPDIKSFLQDDHPADEINKEGTMLSQVEVSRFKDDANAGGNNGNKIEEQKGLAQEGGRTTILEDSNSKRKSLGLGEAEVRPKDGLDSSNLLDTSGLIVDQNPHDKKRKKSKKKKKSATKSLHADPSADEISKEGTILLQAEKANDIGINQINKPEVEKAQVQKEDLKVVPLEEIKKDDQASEGLKSSSRKKRKGRSKMNSSLNESSDVIPEARDNKLADNVESSVDLEKSHNLTDNVGPKKNPQFVTSNTFQLQGSLNAEQRKPAVQPEENASVTIGEKVKISSHGHLKPEVPPHKTVTSSKATNPVCAPQLHTSLGDNTKVSSKENSAAQNVSISSMESKEGKVCTSKGQTNFQTPSRGYSVAVGKPYSKKLGEVLNSSHNGKSLLATPKTIFKESSTESSEDCEPYNSDASTKSPSQNSSSSDDSEGENGGTLVSPQNGSGGQKILNGSGKGVGSSRFAGEKRSLDTILKSSRSYKGAKFSAL